MPAKLTYLNRHCDFTRTPLYAALVLNSFSPRSFFLPFLVSPLGWRETLTVAIMRGHLEKGGYSTFVEGVCTKKFINRLPRTYARPTFSGCLVDIEAALSRLLLLL